MIKFKQKKCDIIIQKATELRDSLAYEANQEFLKRGDVVVDYLNAKLKDAVTKGNTHCVISELTMVAMLTKKYSLPAEDCYKQWIQQFISLLIYTYGYRCEYQQESTDNKIILFFSDKNRLFNYNTL